MDGRIDMVLRSEDKIYVMELKIDRSADEALKQIKDKDYIAKFALEDLPLVKVGINFSTSERTIDDWKIR